MGRKLDGIDAMMATLVLIWGTAFVSLDVLANSLDPFEITWLRYLPFLFVYGIWMLVRRRERFALMGGGDWIRVGACGALAVAGYHIPLNWSMSDVTPGAPIGPEMAAIIVTLTPLFTMIAAVTIRQEKFSLPKAIGASVAFSGVLIVMLLGRTGNVEFVPKAWIALLAPLFWSGYSIVAKPLISKFGGLFVTGLTMCVGTLSFIPIGVARGTSIVSDLGPLEWFWMLYVAIVATVIGYSMWNHALKHRTASEVTVFIFLIPVVATAVGLLLGRVVINAWFVVGAILVLGGLYLVHRERMRTP